MSTVLNREFTLCGRKTRTVWQNEWVWSYQAAPDILPLDFPWLRRILAWMEADSHGITCSGQKIWWGLARGGSDRPSRWGRVLPLNHSLYSIESCLVFHWIMLWISRTHLIVGFLWFRMTTLLHLLESFSCHHLRNAVGYINQRRAENCIHLFEKLGSNSNSWPYQGTKAECHMDWKLEAFTLMHDAQMLWAAAGKGCDLANCSRASDTATVKDHWASTSCCGG